VRYHYRCLVAIDTDNEESAKDITEDGEKEEKKEKPQRKRKRKATETGITQGKKGRKQKRKKEWEEGPGRAEKDKGRAPERRRSERVQKMLNDKKEQEKEIGIILTTIDGWSSEEHEIEEPVNKRKKKKKKRRKKATLRVKKEHEPSHIKEEIDKIDETPAGRIEETNFESRQFAHPSPLSPFPYSSTYSYPTPPPPPSSIGNPYLDPNRVRTPRAADSVWQNFDFRPILGGTESLS